MGSTSALSSHLHLNNAHCLFKSLNSSRNQRTSLLFNRRKSKFGASRKREPERFNKFACFAVDDELIKQQELLGGGGVGSAVEEKPGIKDPYATADHPKTESPLLVSPAATRKPKAETRSNRLQEQRCHNPRPLPDLQSGHREAASSALTSSQSIRQLHHNAASSSPSKAQADLLPRSKANPKCMP
ncbi:hypothetical protein RHMOL_Rhmol12G0099500 [Rhododendron molle]|uniref:Uncharacterized protein n=1 Tax=Rhododendron molle TaxID=49168 RepID=A0ACC0LG77_RHOML|nr:hypothetical protein RHMOL_Rhmol12G0099500 [Rhododendron molle]